MYIAIRPTLSRIDAVLCFYCSSQDKKGRLFSERKREEAYLTKGFRSWKKAPKCFEEHQQTTCHKAPAIYYIVVSKYGDVREFTNQNTVDLHKSERRYLIDVIRCLRLLARQGFAFQGDANEDNFSQFMLLLSTKDDNIKTHLASKEHKYTHHDIQNKLLDLMARQVLRSKVMTIEKNRYFAIMADEYTDKSNK